MKKLLILVVLDLLGGDCVSTHLTKTVVVRIDAEEKVVDETVTEQAAQYRKAHPLDIVCLSGLTSE